MPDLYFNSESGAARDENIALECAVRTAKCLKKLDSYFLNLWLPEGTQVARTHSVFVNNQGNSGYLQELFRLAHGKGKDMVEPLQYLVAKLLKFRQCKPDFESEWIVQNLGVPNTWLHFVAKHRGVLLTLAMEKIWETDPIEFVGRDETVPNIWGQDDISQLVDRIHALSMKDKLYIETLDKKYGVIICGKALENGSFESKEWDAVFDKLRLAQEQRYLPDGDLIKKFEDTKAGALSELVVSGKIRLFFFHDAANGQVYIGEKYIKGQGTDKRPQREAAKRAKQRIISHYFNNL